MLQAHQRLGDFEVLRLLGKGGMGEVYEAQQRNPSRRVALKVLAPWLAADEEALQRFWREAEVPARLDHPSIVRIISTGKTPDGIAYYTMHLVRGLSLAQLIRQASEPPPGAGGVQPTASEALTTPEHPGAGGPSPAAPAPQDGEEQPSLLRAYREDRFAVVARVGLQAARALASAHRQGVLHRDIKPSNLMVDRHEHLYVVDFGLTRALLPDGLCTRPGTLCGTPCYMSPEQARGDVVDARSDLYALGVTLYQLATGGKGPFTADPHDREAVLRQVRSGQSLPLPALAPDVPPALERVIGRAMHFKPGRRYQSAEALAADLERLTGDSPPRPGPAGSGRLSRPVLYGSLVALLAGLAGILFLWQNREPGRPGEPVPHQGGQPEMGRVRVPADDLPPLDPILLNRRYNHQVALLTTEFRPIWSHKLFGKGYLTPMAYGLNLYSPPGPQTLVALDNDPERRWFEFSIDLKPVPRAGAGAGGLGVFFGWHRNRQDPERRYRFFVLQLQEAAGPAVPAELLIGSAYIDEARGAMGGHVEWLHPFPGGKGRLALPWKAARAWRRLHVRALDHKVTVTADESVSVEFDVKELNASPRLRELQGGPLDPRGALGVWASEGTGFFREAWIKAIPPEAREE
jgi:serine/threonine protein kinase